MKSKYIILSILFIWMLSINTNAQSTNTLYFMDGIAERNNVNPAFTPNCNFYLDFIIMPNMYFNFGTNNLVLNDILYLKDGQPTLFLNSQNDIDAFYNKLKPTTNLELNLGINILAFGFKVRKHNFSFDFGISADAYVYIPRDLFSFVLYGTPNANGINSYDLKSLGIESSLYSKVGIGYAYQINDHWQVGVKAKLLMGYANIYTNINQLQLNASRQSWSLHTDGQINASLPISFNTYEDGNIDFSSVALHDNNQLLSLLYHPAGYGASVDFGIQYKPIKSLTISTSITDLGLIYWNKNLINGRMQGEHYINELVDYTVGDTLSSDQIIDKFTNLGNEILNTIKTEDSNLGYKSVLRANFYAGIEYGFFKNKISFGLANHLKFNDKYIQNEAIVAINLRPTNKIKASFNYSLTNGHQSNLGLGLNVRTGIFNVYLLADYIPLSYTRLQVDNTKFPIPNKSNCFNIQVGWAWSIGNYDKDIDRDGIKDKKDRCQDTDLPLIRKQCPGLKKKELINKEGCYLDDDSDGIHNCLDLCPDTPIGVEVNDSGCPLDTIISYPNLPSDTPIENQ